MRLLDNLLPPSEARSYSALPASFGFQQFVDFMTFQGKQYGLAGSPMRMPGDSFSSYVESIHRRTPIISAAAVARALLMSQIRFQVRGVDGVRSEPASLAPLKRPGALKRSAFLNLAEMHTSYSGTAYPVLKNGRLYLLRPDWTQVVLGSASDPVEAPNGEMLPPSDAEIVGLFYQPTDGVSKGNAEMFQVGQFARHAPEPDPVWWWRGVSWVTGVLSEFALDGQVTSHQHKFFEHAATPNLVFLMEQARTPTEVAEFAKVLNETHTGPTNAHKNMFLGGGTDVKVVGSELDKLGLRDLSGAFETRVSARSRVPATILHIAEGNKGSALNSSTYGQTRREWSDLWFTPTADALCESLEDIIRIPNGELTWDPSRVMFLQEDEKDAAEIMGLKMSAMRTGWDGGADPQSVIDAINTGELSKLKHTGNLSVQLQPPGSGDTPTNGAPQ